MLKETLLEISIKKINYRKLSMKLTFAKMPKLSVIIASYL